MKCDRWLSGTEGMIGFRNHRKSPRMGGGAEDGSKIH